VIPGKVVVLRTGALGDFVATLPVLERLSEGAEELLVIAPARFRVLFPRAEQWLDADGIEAARVIAGRGRLAGFELGLCWTRAAAEGLAGSGVGRVLHGAARPPAGVSIYDHLWQPLVDLGVGPRDRDARLRPEPASLAAIDQRLRGARPVVLAPGSGGMSKRRPLEFWLRVAGLLTVPVIWCGGPVERAEGGWGTPRWDDLDLVGLVALAARSRAWLGMDSGPSHLAAAVGARVGVVFTSATDPRQWSPPGAKVFGPEATPEQLISLAGAGGSPA